LAVLARQLLCILARLRVRVCVNMGWTFCVFTICKQKTALRTPEDAIVDESWVSVHAQTPDHAPSDGTLSSVLKSTALAKAVVPRVVHLFGALSRPFSAIAAAIRPGNPPAATPPAGSSPFRESITLEQQDFGVHRDWSAAFARLRAPSARQAGNERARLQLRIASLTALYNSPSAASKVQACCFGCAIYFTEF
jgi:hypothetical protein